MAEQDNTPSRVAADRAAALRVFTLESEAIRALGDLIDGRFTAALDILTRIKGRTVVSGMGKSGHIANKIAATLASTGTPAFFVHPAEASHGDIGMVTKDDAVIAISNSGETHELTDLVAHTRRFAIPLIGITGQERSSLAENSDVALILPRAQEACPIGLAPTTSTTMTLALGDAIAMALMERRGFTADDFQLRHPGGKLGRQLVKVANIMHIGDEIPLIKGTAPMTETLLTMTAKHFGCVGVLDGRDRLIGIITDGDLRRHMAPSLLDLTARDVMTPDPVTIRPNALAAEALGLMNSRGIDRRGINALFVVEAKRVVGVVHIHDCLRAGVA
ncbi:MAG TPA: KpsF/GutQ family sugar-phosphate isomerase [Alphaproteobacteria bacterium]|nr:KpsF/GutQ family sugar-phosphate isomerase [Alphaproteobacteria bacterium]